MLRRARTAQSHAAPIPELRERPLQRARRGAKLGDDRAVSEPGAGLVKQRTRSGLRFLFDFGLDSSQHAAPVLGGLIAAKDHPHGALGIMDLNAALTDRAGVHDLAQIRADFGAHHMDSHSIQTPIEYRRGPVPIVPMTDASINLTAA